MTVSPTGKLKIFCSFSGGRSSARMCALLRELYPDAEIIFVFANTGEEHWKTLEFVDKCDKYFGLNLIWVEAKVNGPGEGTTHTIVTFETCSRKGEPFEAIIKKYGIPNQPFPHCTRELKMAPMYSYLASIGWEKGTYIVALGIRADEPKRLSAKAAELGIFYPLAEAGLEKQDILDYWAEMPFDLGIEEHEGNCKWCWKKSDKKHVLNIKANRDWYDFPKLMEERHGLARADLSPVPRTFFRKNRSTQDMLDLADAVDAPNIRQLNRPEENSGCSESCEATFDGEKESA